MKLPNSKSHSRDRFFLEFRLGFDRFALPGESIVEIIPKVSLRNIPNSPDYVRGLMYYRDAIVPVIDLCQLAIGDACKNRYSTRILLTRYPTYWKEMRLLGLMVEHATEMFTIHPDLISPPGIMLENAPFMSDVLKHETGLIQSINLEKILPKSLQKELFLLEEDKGNVTGKD